jgi:transcriptional regulator with PAS, ATPase and Fis domain
MLAIYGNAAKVARGDISVLILGESGTGKEILARYIHQASPVADGPMLSLNCAALPRDLLEAELFGVERGVATGIEARPGKFELADGGTLFLDEIGDMAPDTQARILRVLQSGEVYRIGGRQAKKVQIRILAATNRDITTMIDSGAFRADLYHRIAGWVVELPPLRQRRADIPNLAAHFLSRAGDRAGVRIRGVSRQALETLTACHWPGNIRELETEMNRAVLFLEDGELLDSGRLSSHLQRPRTAPITGALADQLEHAEREIITRTLHETASTDAAAERLGISRATLYRRLKALGIERDSGRGAS